jgi:GNAT superfamily N-acetyltransferase
MRLSFSVASDADAAAIAAIRTAAAEELTARFGHGHWSSSVTEQGVLQSMKHAKIVVGRAGPRIVTFARLATKKPWAIDADYFTPCTRPLYLTDMTVAPQRQRQGAGRQCLDAAVRVAREWPSDAIRLDAYDHAAGAGPFYAKCGFTERGRVRYRGTPLVYFELVLADVLESPSRS